MRNHISSPNSSITTRWQGSPHTESPNPVFSASPSAIRLGRQCLSWWWDKRERHSPFKFNFNLCQSNACTKPKKPNNTTRIHTEKQVSQPMHCTPDFHSLKAITFHSFSYFFFVFTNNVLILLISWFFHFGHYWLLTLDVLDSASSSITCIIPSNVQNDTTWLFQIWAITFYWKIKLIHGYDLFHD